jgi:molybdopterin synthase sulfur carrier subunit
VNITVRLFATFRDFLPQPSVHADVHLELEGGESIGAVLEAFHLPVELPKIVLLNGRHAIEDSLLADGDVVSVFPPLIGGQSSLEH